VVALGEAMDYLNSFALKNWTAAELHLAGAGCGHSRSRFSVSGRLA